MNSDLVYDVGMGNGDDTAYYLHLGYKVLAIEANPLRVAEAKGRFHQEISTHRLVLLNLGITQTEAELDFWINDETPDFSSFQKELASKDGSAVRCKLVKTTTLDRVIQEFGIPYYCKIDIEGSDIVCVEALDATATPQYISVESGNPRILVALHEKGYDEFKIIDQVSLLTYEVPETFQMRKTQTCNRILGGRHLLSRILRKAIGRRFFEEMRRAARRHGDWDFPFGSSGPFGEHTPGRWLSFPEVTRTWDHYQQLRDKGYSMWVDFHARKGN